MSFKQFELKKAKHPPEICSKREKIPVSTLFPLGTKAFLNVHSRGKKVETRENNLHLCCMISLHLSLGIHIVSAAGIRGTGQPDQMIFMKTEPDWLQLPNLKPDWTESNSGLPDIYIYIHNIYIYTQYIYIHNICMYIYIYIHYIYNVYIYIQREREIPWNGDWMRIEARI